MFLMDKKISLLFLLIFISLSSFAQNFYDRATVQKIEIFFASANWDAQLDAAFASDAYIIADSVRINDQTFDSVGVKYKGNSSYNANNNKNPFRIELDHIKGSQDYQGYTDIKLQNGYKDPSMIREVLSYAILEQFMDCSKANFANVYVNGTLRGLYSNAESINKKFKGDHYYLSNDSYFKCNPSGGAGPGNNGSPDLRYINADSSSYYNAYELKSDFGWNRLVDLVNTLNNNTSSLETKLDVDRALWMLAFNNVLVNLDSYNGAFRQNYYLTWDLNNRFVPTVWDLNMSFAGFPGGTGSGAYTPSTLDPMSNSTSTIHPLIVKLMANPMYKRMYLAHIRTIVQEIFVNQNYLTTANALRTTISASVQADQYKFFTFTQFQNSLTTSVILTGPGASTIPGIQELMSARATYFSTNSNYLLAAPLISSFGASDNTPNYNQTIYITATCSNESTVYLGYRLNHQLKFNRVQMFDDGAHGDGAAGDNVYGFQVTLNGTAFEYYIYAENSNAGLFSPTRAEHEFHSLQITFPFCNNGNVIINEFLTINSDFYHDSNGESDDWIELYNTTSSAINLSGMYLSDDATDLTLWPFPLGTIIPANSYLIVWCDDDIEQSGLHTNFKLSSLNGVVIFGNGALAFSQVPYGFQSSNISYARCPDGGTSFNFVYPTPNANNNCSAGVNELGNSFELSLFPNPVNETLTISISDALIYNISIYDLQGRIIFKNEFLSAINTLSTADWNNGIYHVIITNSEGKSINRSLVKISN
jgi:hypothetical protein